MPKKNVSTPATPKKPKDITAALWRKLKPHQKEIYVTSYDTFLSELNALSQIHNRVKAHNLAYLNASSVEIE